MFGGSVIGVGLILRAFRNSLTFKKVRCFVFVIRSRHCYALCHCIRILRKYYRLCVQEVFAFVIYGMAYAFSLGEDSIYEGAVVSENRELNYLLNSDATYYQRVSCDIAIKDVSLFLILLFAEQKFTFNF